MGRQGILGLFGFALATAYVPWIVGAGSTPRWAVLVIGALSILAIDPARNRITLAHILGGLFMLWALASWLIWPNLDGFDAMWKLALMAALFMVGASVSDLRPLFTGAAIGIGISSALVILDIVGLVNYQQVSRPSGLFVNGLYMAEFAAMVAAGLVGYGVPWWTALCCIPALFTIPADGTTLRNLHANNDFMEIAYELGIPGMVLAVGFMAMLIFSGRFEGSPAKLVLIAFAVEACFGFPLHLPATAGLFAFAAGHVSRDNQQATPRSK